MKKTLVLFAHPYFEYSTANIELLQAYKDVENVDVKDLYEEYPDFHIPAFRERKRLRQYEKIIFHFPLIWFGMPPLLKLWIDEVFDMTWTAEVDHPLQNTEAAIIVTMGGKKEDYLQGGKYATTVFELLKALKLSLKVNGVIVKNILEIYDADDLQTEDLKYFAEKIEKIIHT